MEDTKMILDLNVHWPQKDYSTPPTQQQIFTLKNVLITLEELGYTHVALNFTLNHSDKVSNVINPIDLTKFKEFEGRIKLYTRVTIIIDEPSQGQSIAKLQGAFDIVSALPISEKGLLLACNNLDIDIITFRYNERLPTFLKHKTIGAAVKRGVKFEVTYTNYLSDSRSQFINNTLNVLRASRNQNIIISSGATEATQVRTYHDIFNIFSLLGFKQSDRNLVQDKAAKVLLNGRLRLKSYKQTVMLGKDVINEDTTSGNNVIKRNIKDVEGGEVFKRHLKKVKEKK